MRWLRTTCVDIALTVAVLALATSAHGPYRWLVLIVGLVVALVVKALVQPGVDGKRWPDGQYAVQLLDSGESKIPLAIELRAIAGAKLHEAKALVDSPPAWIVQHVDEPSAVEIAGRLKGHGAQARVVLAD
jgi:ribosomal protein L7/L12